MSSVEAELHNFASPLISPPSPGFPHLSPFHALYSKVDSLFCSDYFYICTYIITYKDNITKTWPAECIFTDLIYKGGYSLQKEASSLFLQVTGYLCFCQGAEYDMTLLCQVIMPIESAIVLSNF